MCWKVCFWGVGVRLDVWGLPFCQKTSIFTADEDSKIYWAPRCFAQYYPIGSMYGIFSYILANLYGKCRYCKYTRHGSYGLPLLAGKKGNIVLLNYFVIGKDTQEVQVILKS